MGSSLEEQKKTSERFRTEYCSMRQTRAQTAFLAGMVVVVFLLGARNVKFIYPCDEMARLSRRVRLRKGTA